MKRARLIDYIRGLAAATRTVHRGNCFFTISTGRTGTDTLAALVGLSPIFVSLHEPDPQLLEHRAAAYRDRHRLSHLRRLRIQMLRAPRQVKAAVKGRHYFESSPRMTHFATELLTSLDERAVFLYRDAPEFVRSGMRRGWYSGQHWADESRIVPRQDDTVAEEWHSMDQFAKLCWHWAQVNSWGLECLHRFPKKVFPLASSDLFSGNGQELARLFAFLGVETPSETAIKGVLDRKMNKQTTGDFPPCSDWTDREHAELNRYCGKVASRLALLKQS